MPRLPSPTHLLCTLRLDARWDGAALAVLVSGVILVGVHERAMAQAIDNTLWVTNGTVNAVVQDGGTIYIGGDFTQVGPATGGAVPLDAATGQPIAIPKVAGLVSAIVLYRRASSLALMAACLNMNRLTTIIVSSSANTMITGIAH